MLQICILETVLQYKDPNYLKTFSEMNSEIFIDFCKYFQYDT